MSSDEPDRMMFKSPPKPGECARLVIVDRIADIDGLPEYCVHGRGSCLNCGEMCYLGSETVKAVQAPGTFPCCLPCARANIPYEDASAGRLEDHLRTDGPH